MRRFLAALLVSFQLAHPAATRDWGNLDALLTGSLTGGQPLVDAYFFPDAADPAAATRALAIAYTVIPGAAGTVDIHVGLFARAGGGWGLAHRVRDLFGTSPAAPRFGPGHVEITTDTLGPNDPRCCPSRKTTWRIDVATGAVSTPNQVRRCRPARGNDPAPPRPSDHCTRREACGPGNTPLPGTPRPSPREPNDATRRDVSTEAGRSLGSRERSTRRVRGRTSPRRHVLKHLDTRPAPG